MGDYRMSVVRDGEKGKVFSFLGRMGVVFGKEGSEENLQVVRH